MSESYALLLAVVFALTAMAFVVYGQPLNAVAHAVLAVAASSVYDVEVGR